MSATIKPSSGQNKITNYAAFGMAVSLSLQQTIREMAKLHDGKAGPWLDELEAKCIEQATGLQISDVSEEDTTEAMKFAKDGVEGVFKVERERLTASGT